ncbi:MAG: RNA polymerase sigma factor [Microbacteriaceae bacterium]
MADEPQRDATNPIPLTAGTFDAFIGPHLPVLLRVARSLCSNAQDAEDLVQDTLIRAFKGLSTFDGAYPRAWLMTIMRNANINRNRRQRPGLLRDASGLAGEADRRNPPAPSAEDVATAHQPAPWIADALGRLSERHLQVVNLVDIDGLTYNEAAVALGIPAGTVMSRLHRARHRMRAYLTQHPDFRSEHV